MRHALIVALVCLLPACGGGSSPTAPSPQPAQPTHIAGTITDTMTGATVGTFSAEAMGFPAKVTVSASGYVTRETWVRSASPNVDLIAEAGFDLGFYRQFARGTLENATQPLRVLNQAPSIYLQTAGLTAANVAALEQSARMAVEGFSGGKFQVATFQAGADARSPQVGWIVVDIINSADPCGRSQIGAPAGHVWMNVAPRCAFNGYAVNPPSLAHEIGHALGFWHVAQTGSLMKSDGPYSVSVPSDLERRHAALAYHRSAGNMDIDVDPVAPSALRAIIIE